MIYPTPIIIPISRGYSVSIGSVPLSTKVAASSVIIAIMLLAGSMWWELINELDSKLEQIILTLFFFSLEVSLICVLVEIL